jgi:superfamily II DNA helicase RecQ
VTLRGDLDRESLHLGVVALPTFSERLGWLADHLDDLPGSGIIYCLTVAATADVADFLAARGHRVRAYSGQTEQAERLAAESDLLDNSVKALVATSALGMGFDKPDLGFVIHLGAPPSPIAYYQQVGRAGRGVDRATVLLLAGREDAEVWRYFGSLSFPDEEHVRRRCRCSTPPPGHCRRRPSRARCRWGAVGWRRCSRCSTSTVLCAGVRGAGADGQPWATTPSATPGDPHPPRSRTHAGLPGDRGDAGCGSCASSSTIQPRRLRRCDNCGGLT